jgi:hypothetical protein
VISPARYRPNKACCHSPACPGSFRDSCENLIELRVAVADDVGSIGPRAHALLQGRDRIRSFDTEDVGVVGYRHAQGDEWRGLDELPRAFVPTKTITSLARTNWRSINTSATCQEGLWPWL